MKHSLIISFSGSENLKHLFIIWDQEEKNLFGPRLVEKRGLIVLLSSMKFYEIFSSLSSSSLSVLFVSSSSSSPNNEW